MQTKTLLFFVNFIIAGFTFSQTPGNSLHFDGANDYVSMSLPSVFSNIGTNDFTVETWYKPQSFGTTRIFHAQFSTTNFVSILLNATGIPYFFLYDNGTLNSINTGSALAAGSWHHIAMTWVASTNTLSVYINGVLTVGAAGGSSSTGTSNLMTIGSRTDGTQLYTGEMDEFRIWNVARSACEINASKNSEFTALPSNVVAYYNFNHGTAGSANPGVNTLIDLTMNSNGTLNNFALSGSTSNWLASGAGITQVNNSTGLITATDIQSSCNPIVWLDGNTYASNNTTATHTVNNPTGCDTLYTLNFTLLNTSSGTDVQSACDTYVWIDGNTYTSSNSTAQFVLPNAQGCDSTITLNLTILPSSAGTDVQTACDSFSWIDGNTYTTSNNSAQFSLTNAAGCDSIVTLNLTLNSVNTAVTNASPTLTASAVGAAYQWIDCSNGNSPIGNANAQSYVATANGSYAVVVTENNCSDTSTCEMVANVGINHLDKSNSISLFPNPSKNVVTVSISDWKEKRSILIVNTVGQIVYRTVSEHKTTPIHHNLTPGMYFVQIGDVQLPLMVY